MEWLLWLDIETTGIDIDSCKILQIACVLTNMTLDVEHIFGEITIKYNQDDLQNMDEWCLKTHTESGLLDKVKTSTFNIDDTEKCILLWLNNHVSSKDVIYLAGNSVHFDKNFINKYMTNLSSRLNYRIIDVSSVSLLCKNLNNSIYLNKPKKQLNHTALSDILESLEEMRYYTREFLQLGFQK